MDFGHFRSAGEFGDPDLVERSPAQQLQVGQAQVRVSRRHFGGHLGKRGFHGELHQAGDPNRPLG
jgi:hypothetical protein